MITIKSKTNPDIKYEFSITKFSDGTSQVWKVTPSIDGPKDAFQVLWQFESETEFSHVLQLGCLLNTYCEHMPELYMPFLPYGRQDKHVANDLTFAKQPILESLCKYYYLTTFDAHSNKKGKYYSVFSIEPNNFHREIFGHDLIAFPDIGAQHRYAETVPAPVKRQLFFEKTRNQQSGEITGMKIVSEINVTGKTVLIVDDICDGGRTFIECANILKNAGAGQIDLAVTHGIFSKGKAVLHQAGITNIYTTNSLLQNADQFNVL